MNEYEERIEWNRKRKNRIITSFGIILLFFIGFYVGGRMSYKKNFVVSAENSVKSEAKKTEENLTNVKETKIDDTKKIEQNNSSNININNTQNAADFDPYKKDGKKIAYLTFDDGPSTNNTPKILEILKKNNIKATFFLIGKCAEQNPELVKREIAEGHVVANHTYNHPLNFFKETPENFINDVDKCAKVLSSILGDSYKIKLLRFPGGTLGHSKQKIQPYADIVKKDGYHYVDWNDLNGDAERNYVPVDTLINNIKTYSTEEHVVILMHDAAAKETTVQALPQIIEYLKSLGYTFDTLK